MIRWCAAVVLIGLLTVAAVFLVAGDYPYAGPVVWRPDYGHGVRRGDVAIVCCWGVGVAATLGLLLRRRAG